MTSSDETLPPAFFNDGASLTATLANEPAPTTETVDIRDYILPMLELQTALEKIADGTAARPDWGAMASLAAEAVLVPGMIDVAAQVGAMEEMGAEDRQLVARALVETLTAIIPTPEQARGEGA